MTGAGKEEYDWESVCSAVGMGERVAWFEEKGLVEN